jgi:hypothetical protein
MLKHGTKTFLDYISRKSEYALCWFLLQSLAPMNMAQIPVMRHGLSHVETYDVTSDELERIESEGADVGFDFHIGLFCLTMATSFLIGLILSPPPPEKLKTFVVFVVIVVVGFLAGGIFAVKWFRSRRAFSETIRRIRERVVGPLGEKGNEVRPAELEQLPSEESGSPPEPEARK